MLGARMLLAITMVFTYPMECFVCRHALVSVIRSYQEKDIGTGDHEPSSSSVNNPENGDGQQAPSQDHQEEEAVDTVTHVALTLGLWGSTVIIALVFNDLRIVLALTGTPFICTYYFVFVVVTFSIIGVEQVRLLPLCLDTFFLL